MRADDIESSERASSSADHGSADEAARLAWQNITELLEYGLHFVAARADQFRHTILRTVLWAVVGVLGAIALFTLIVVSVVQFLGGLAAAIGTALGSPWIGNLILGGGMIGLLALSIWLGSRSILTRSRKKTVAKYEQRKNVQRNRFGHTVAERARTSAAAQRV